MDLAFELAKGDWVISPILRKLKTQLSAGAKSTELGLSGSCLSHFRKIPPEKILLRSNSKGVTDIGLNPLVNDEIKKLLLPDFPHAEAGFLFKRDEIVKIKNALSLIREVDVKLADLVDEAVELFIKVDNVSFRSASHPHILGVIFLGNRIYELSEKQLAVSIIHELAHQELFLLNLMDRLVVKDFDHNEIHAPFQDRKRPPIGRLHSLWALNRMVKFEFKAGLDWTRHYKTLLENCKAFEEGELTTVGKLLVKLSSKQVA